MHRNSYEVLRQLPDLHIAVHVVRLMLPRMLILMAFAAVKYERQASSTTARLRHSLWSHTGSSEECLFTCSSTAVMSIAMMLLVELNSHIC